MRGERDRPTEHVIRHTLAHIYKHTSKTHTFLWAWYFVPRTGKINHGEHLNAFCGCSWRTITVSKYTKLFASFLFVTSSYSEPAEQSTFYVRVCVSGDNAIRLNTIRDNSFPVTGIEQGALGSQSILSTWTGNVFAVAHLTSTSSPLPLSSNIWIVHSGGLIRGKHQYRRSECVQSIKHGLEWLSPGSSTGGRTGAELPGGWLDLTWHNRRKESGGESAWVWQSLHSKRYVLTSLTCWRAGTESRQEVNVEKKSSMWGLKTTGTCGCWQICLFVCLNMLHTEGICCDSTVQSGNKCGLMMPRTRCVSVICYTDAAGCEDRRVTRCPDLCGTVLPFHYFSSEICSHLGEKGPTNN